MPTSHLKMEELIPKRLMSQIHRRQWTVSNLTFVCVYIHTVQLVTHKHEVCFAIRQPTKTILMHIVKLSMLYIKQKDF
jgi:hypothetical protein